MKTRKSNRTSLNALATCRNAVGRQWEAELSDLSEGGCRVADGSGQIQNGERLNIFVAGTGPHVAEATWRRDDDVGLAFRRPLPDTVLEAIAAQDGDAGDAQSSAADPATALRRFV